MDMLVEKYNGLLGKSVYKIDKECKDILINYPWYGNVRELENAVEFMINMADDSGVVTADMLPPNIVENKKNNSHGSYIDGDIRPLKDIEKRIYFKSFR